LATAPLRLTCVRETDDSSAGLKIGPTTTLDEANVEHDSTILSPARSPGYRRSSIVEPERTAEDAELSQLFEAVSCRLSEKQKAAFVLREMQDCETREIAEILGCGESTVRNHLFNARRILRKEMERLYPEFLRGRNRP